MTKLRKGRPRGHRSPPFCGRKGLRILLAYSAAAIAGPSCAGASGSSDRSAAGRAPRGAVTRYRLLLRDNPVDPGEAFRCYGRCQAQETPTGYLKCLIDCPGFEITQGAACERYEVPPVAACFNARRIPRRAEVEPGYVVIAVVANVALVVALASLCASSDSQCGYLYTPY